MKRLMPKKQFKLAVPIKIESTQSLPVPKGTENVTLSSERDLCIYNKVGETIEMHESPVSLTLRNLRGCTVRCGPVRTSVYMENCVDCRFSLAAPQMRASGLANCSLYLYAPTGLTIECSSDVAVHPYDFEYEGLASHMRECGLAGRPNKWDLVNDFTNPII